MGKFKSMNKDTNAQEGLGGFLQSLKNYKKLGLQGVFESVEMFVISYENRRKVEKNGMSTRYSKSTPAEKRSGRESRAEYKAPESGSC